MTAYDSTSFSAGHDCGTRVAACVVRLAALELIDDARWWNRWRHRLMARALVACAEELECAADRRGGRDTSGMDDDRPALVSDAGEARSRPFGPRLTGPKPVLRSV
jgi:hypothetical protein